MTILKPRQVGATILISAVAFYEMNAEPGARVCVVTPHQEAYSYEIWRIYKQFHDSTHTEELRAIPGSYLKTHAGSEVWIGDHFGGHGEDGRGNGIPGKITDFDIVHFVEPGYSTHFRDHMERLPKYPRNQMVVIESSGCRVGCDFHDFWIGDPSYRRADFSSFFVPWFVHDEYRIGFKSDQERYDFEDKTPSILKELGMELPVGEPYNRNELWMRRWEESFEFNEWIMEPENLQWYYRVFRELNGSASELKRQYPTYASEAFQC